MAKHTRTNFNASPAMIHQQIKNNIIPAPQNIKAAISNTDNTNNSMSTFGYIKVFIIVLLLICASWVYYKQTYSVTKSAAYYF